MWYTIVLILLAAIIFFGCYALITGKHLELISVVITALILRLGTMLDFKYGSSEGSKTKTTLMAKENERPITFTPAPVPAPIIAAPVYVAQIPDGKVKVTQEMLDADPTLVANGVKVGDIIDEPKKEEAK